MKQPLIVGFIADRGTHTSIRRLGCELLPVSSLPSLPTMDFPRPPHLFVLQVTDVPIKQVCEVLQSLRGQRPLTDVVLWSPGASGAEVRCLFRAGARDVIASPTSQPLLDSIQETLDQQQILPRLNELSRQRDRGARFEKLLSRSQAMWELFTLCSQIAPAAATVLILGETGTGKELLAGAIHHRSGRPGRFVTANCASIRPELIHSELFGHAKGAFTGADRSKKGLVSHAHGGTLFLDEIGDMPGETQQSLLRLLQEKQFRPLGSLHEIKVDVRIVAATNVPLDEAVREGDFREDLFYRLDVIRMNVPPLRERPEDILLLFGYFAKSMAKHYRLTPPTFSNSFLDALLNYDWPGNVRQLQNFSERLVLARPQRALNAQDFDRLGSASLTDPKQREPGNRSRRKPPRIDTSQALRDHLDSAIAELEQAYLQTALEQNAGHVSKTADVAGISRRTLLRKMKQYNINKTEFKD